MQKQILLGADEYNTLRYRLFQIFKECLLLINDEHILKKINKRLTKKNDIIEEHIRISNKNLRSFYKKYYNYNDSINIETNESIVFINILYKILINKDEELISYLY